MLELSKKEYKNIVQLEKYKNFINNIFNKETLDGIILLSKYYVNLIEYNKFNKKENFLLNNLFIEKFVYESNRSE